MTTTIKPTETKLKLTINKLGSLKQKMAKKQSIILMRNYQKKRVNPNIIKIDFK